MIPEYIERLNTIFGDSLDKNAQEITFWGKKIKEAYELRGRLITNVKAKPPKCLC